MMLTFYLTSLAVAIFRHIHATTFLYPWRLHVKGAYINVKTNILDAGNYAKVNIYEVTFINTNNVTKIGNVNLKKMFSILMKVFRRNWLTHWCVKSNMLLVWVEILVLLSTELANIAPSFCREKPTIKTFVFSFKSM